MPISDKAKRAIARFPVTDLAVAVGRNRTAREGVLRDFLGHIPRSSYAATRGAAGLIYGVELPFDTTGLVPWEKIAAQIRRTAAAHDVERNVEAAKCLFDLVRPAGYKAYPIEPEPLRVATGRKVIIDLPYHLVDGERLVFQFLHARRTRESDSVIRALASMIHHAYAVGDYADAEIEVADLSQPEKKIKERGPCIRAVPRADIMSLSELTAEIEDVHGMLLSIAESMGP